MHYLAIILDCYKLTIESFSLLEFSLDYIFQKVLSIQFQMKAFLAILVKTVNFIDYKLLNRFYICKRAKS